MEKEYFLAHKDDKNKKKTWVYDSDKYKFTEIDMLNAIKIFIVEGRNKSLGKKFLAVYEYANESDLTQAQAKLNKIGIQQNGNIKPTDTETDSR